MVTVKYILIVLRADDEGEGGTFALYSLLSRYAHIAKRDPREETTVKMERYRTNDLGRMNKSARNLIERNGFIKVMLKFVGVLGVSLVLSGNAPERPVDTIAFSLTRQMESSPLHSPFWAPFRGKTLSSFFGCV